MWRSWLATQDPLLAKRTWQTVMDQIQTHGKDSSRIRYERAMKCQAFNAIRKIKLVETTAEDLLAVMSSRKVSLVHYLKRLHNLALGSGGSRFQCSPPGFWPKPHFKPKRQIPDTSVCQSAAPTMLVATCRGSVTIFTGLAPLFVATNGLFFSIWWACLGSLCCGHE